MTPKQAYNLVAKAAKAEKKSMRAYCRDHGVHHSTVIGWKTKGKSPRIETLQKLLGKIRF
jgi:hypothetical protein